MILLTMRKKNQDRLCNDPVFILWVVLVTTILFVLCIHASKAHAYETLYNSGSTGIATSTSGGNSLTWTNNSTRSWLVIDCEANGWSEIASTTVEMDTVSSSGSFRLWDDWSGRQSVENPTITTTQRAYSYTFSPALWCEGRQVIFTRMKSTSPNIRMFGNNSAVPHLTGSYTISGPSTNNTLTGSETSNNLPAMIIWGSLSTSTPTPSGSGTTTYNFLVSTSTNDTAEAISFWSAIFVVLAVWVIIARLIQS